MFKIFITIIFSLFFLLGCSSKSEKEIIIATNQWIGYTPLFYAYETGALDNLNIQLINTASLTEAAELYRVGKANIVTTTQHEYNMLKHETKDIVPVILLDRSNGGDMVLANRDIEQLQNEKKIFVYLEVDSINQEIIKDFIKHNNLDIKKMVFINKDQRQIQDVAYTDEKPILIVTYVPYNVGLVKKGFKEVASTKSIESIIVIDALCSTNELLRDDKARLLALKRSIDESIEMIQKDPLTSYKVVKKYLSDISYREYIEALNAIKWINKPSKELLDFIKDLDYSEETIIK